MHGVYLFDIHNINDWASADRVKYINNRIVYYFTFVSHHEVYDDCGNGEDKDIEGEKDDCLFDENEVERSAFATVL